MPFVETILLKDDNKKFKKIGASITQDLLQVFKIKKNTITIYNNIIKKKNFYHNSIFGNKEKRIFIKISGLKRSKKLKKKLALQIIKNLIKLVKVKNPNNIAVYFFDKTKADIFHG